MIFAETAYSVFKSISSPEEMQRFYDMIERDRAAALPAKFKKNTDQDFQAKIKLRVSRELLARQSRVLKNRTHRPA